MRKKAIISFITMIILSSIPVYGSTPSENPRNARFLASLYSNIIT